VVLVWFGAGGGRVVVWMFGVGLWALVVTNCGEGKLGEFDELMEFDDFTLSICSGLMNTLGQRCGIS
jgi:hypothetical protein